MSGTLRRGFAALALVSAGQAGLAAEIGLREDLRPRVEQLTSLYGSLTNRVDHGPILLPTEQGVRILGLTGTIEPGDADRLAALIGPEDSVQPFVLVLDSPGGNFLEGVRLGEVLRPFRGGNGDPALSGVLVLAGERCMSACAVAFALSALPRDSGVSVRYVERGAELGFHMPFVPVDQQAVQAEVAQAMDLTYRIMSEYIQLIANGIAPTALVQNSLHYRRPQDFFLLRGGLMTRFMDFVPVGGPEAATPLALEGLRERDALNMCQVLAYSRGSRMTADDYEWWPYNAFGEETGDRMLTEVFGEIGAWRLAVEGCSIEWRGDDTLGIQASGRCGSESVNAGWCAAPKEEFDPFLPAATGALLGDSLGCHGGALTRAYYSWDSSNAFLEEEEPDRYRWSGETDADVPKRFLDWSGARLASNLNIRSAPGGEVVARWTEGAPVEVQGCTLAADGQGVWYQVASGGVSGWASARYVRVPALETWNGLIRPAGVE